MTSREYFEAASAAQRHIDALYRKLGTMRAREGARSKALAVAHAGGATDPMRATDARIDAEAEARAEMAELDDKVNIKIDDRVTVPSSLARLHNRHWRHRTFAAFDHPSLLLSAGRSLSL